MNLSSKQIILCRHAETEWALSGRHTSATDIPLTFLGKKQAANLGKKLLSFSFQTIFCSPALRTRETCEAAQLSCTPIFEPDAREWDYGTFEGLTHQEILQKAPHWDLFLQGAPGGESPHRVTLRADRLLEKCKAAAGNVLIISHGHFLRLFAARWIGLEASGGRHFSLAVASVSVLSFEHEIPIIRMWNVFQ